jgi:hypothetical protein
VVFVFEKLIMDSSIRSWNYINKQVNLNPLKTKEVRTLEGKTKKPKTRGNRS